MREFTAFYLESSIRLVTRATLGTDVSAAASYFYVHYEGLLVSNLH